MTGLCLNLCWPNFTHAWNWVNIGLGNAWWRENHSRWLGAIYTPQPLRPPGYCRRPSGRATGQTSPVNTLTSIIFHGSFSNLARTFITLRFQTSSIMEVLPHLDMRIMDHLMSQPLLTFLNSFFFQTKVTKFGLNMLINISSGFFHSRQKKNFGDFFSHFPTSHMENHR